MFSAHSLTKRVLSTLFCFLFSFALLLSACKGSPSETTRSVSANQIQVTIVPGMEPYVFRTSQPGSITLHGMLFVLDPMTLVPAPDDAIYLVSLPTDQPITSVPQFEPGTVPQADVDERTGEFTFTDIQPGQYAIVAITVGGAQIPVRYMNGGSYTILTLDASQIDTTIELGNLSLP